MQKYQSTSTKRLLLKTEKDLQNQGQLVNPAFLPCMLFFFVVLDYMTIHQLIDVMFYQSFLLTVLVTAGIAILLEGIPCIGAHFFMKENRNDSDTILFLILTGVFVILFLALFALRWYSRELVFSDSGAGLEVTAVQSGAAKAVVPEITMAENMMTILLGISPLATSVLAFCLACSFSASEKKKKRKSLADIHLKHQADLLEASAGELKDELKRDLYRYDTQMYQTALAELNTYAKLLKNIVRQRTAVHIGTSNAVRRLLENGEGTCNEEN